MNTSFYGGREGISFNIVKSYKTKEEMEQAFSQGGQYTEVGYGEYVIIDTDNKNDVTNGQIYRRGVTGPEEIGRVVGPSGHSPHVVLENDPSKIPTGDSRKESGITLNPGEGNFYAGTKDGDNPIKMSLVSVRDKNGIDTTCYVYDFKIPYMTTEWAVNSNAGDPYEAPVLTQTANSPFYQSYELTIPKGVKGNSIKEVKVITVGDFNNHKGPKYPESLDSGLRDEGKIYVATCVNYDERQEAETLVCLGPYNVISDIELTQNGKLTFKMTYDKPHEMPNKIKWIDTIKLEDEPNKADGQMEITYNTGEVKKIPFHYPTGFYVNPNNGNITTQMWGATNQTQEGAFNSIQDILIDPQTKRPVIHFTGNLETKIIETPYKVIEAMKVDPNDFQLKVHYTTTGGEGPEDPSYWEDLGEVKSESGILIGEFLQLAGNVTEVIAQLNQKYPKGFTEPDKKGKVAIVSPDPVASATNKAFYAFDYHPTAPSWYYIGSISDNDFPGSIVGKDQDPVTESLKARAPVGTPWFVVEEI